MPMGRMRWHRVVTLGPGPSRRKRKAVGCFPQGGCREHGDTRQLDARLLSSIYQIVTSWSFLARWLSSQWLPDAIRPEDTTPASRIKATDYRSNTWRLPGSEIFNFCFAKGATFGELADSGRLRLASSVGRGHNVW